MTTSLIKPAYELTINPPYNLNYNDEIVREALRLAREKFKGNTAAIPSTVNLDAKKGDVLGSNWYFANIVPNSMNELEPNKRKVRPMNAREVQLFLKHDLIEDARFTYDDEGFTFYREISVNPKLHKHIREQISSYEWKSKFEHVDSIKPFLLTGSVDITPDDHFEYGLRVDLNKFSEVYNHPSLLKGGEVDKNDPGLIETGLPYSLGSGDRELLTAEDGVRRLCRDGNVDLNARYDNLSDSNDTGRVRLVENFSDVSLDKLVKK